MQAWIESLVNELHEQSLVTTLTVAIQTTITLYALLVMIIVLRYPQLHKPMQNALREILYINWRIQVIPLCAMFIALPFTQYIILSPGRTFFMLFLAAISIGSILIGFTNAVYYLFSSDIVKEKDE